METKEELLKIYRRLVQKHPNVLTAEERQIAKNLLLEAYREKSDKAQISAKFTQKLKICEIAIDEISLGKPTVIVILFLDMLDETDFEVEKLEKIFSVYISSIVSGMSKIKGLYEKHLTLETENFRKLFISIAEDIRVVLIAIATRLQTMRELEQYDENTRLRIARESAFLYAPMAHRMGLYVIKSELEDLSLKYTNRKIYKEIARKLNETKRSRDKYITEFIAPLKEKLSVIGCPFEIKGRTKSIHSIYNKMQKQKTDFENIYDLFAIRIIFDTPMEKEKTACWQAYAIIADMYQPNPNRLRDWLSMPKSNGYESLHTTVVGLQGKWVEVQIRTERMNEIAEKGLAAHWKYKGGKSEIGMDEWLKNIREILENPTLNAVDFMDEFQLNIYDKEVFVFTPNGDLHKFPKGATALDFAFSIHSNLGVKCVGAIVNGKNMPIKYQLSNGDQVQILTSQVQKPNTSWLKIATTAKAKNKIRQALKEVEYKDAEMGREILLRRFKNWKIELDDGRLSRLSRKKGYKRVSDFYEDIAQEKLDILQLREAYLGEEQKELQSETDPTTAENFTHQPLVDTTVQGKEDVLIIGDNLKNLDMKMAKCCNPIYGDKVFGFVSVTGGIKIHRNDCPNAPQLISRFGYRIVEAQWAGKTVGTQYPVTLHIVGNDNIGIVTNITSLISKDLNVNTRAISIDSNAGLFYGNLTVMIESNKALEKIIKKIEQIKGVKSVSRA